MMKADLLKLLTSDELAEAFNMLRKAESQTDPSVAHALSSLRSLLAVRASDFQKSGERIDPETGEVLSKANIGFDPRQQHPFGIAKSATIGETEKLEGPFIIVNKTTPRGNNIKRTLHGTKASAAAHAQRIIEAAVNERKTVPQLLLCEVINVVRHAPPPIVLEPATAAFAEEPSLEEGME